MLCFTEKEIEKIFLSKVVNATKPIYAGEEILISYLGECEVERSRHSRQKYLKENYMFECWCAKCRFAIFY